jgi:hypothetical protein
MWSLEWNSDRQQKRKQRGDQEVLARALPIKPKIAQWSQDCSRREAKASGEHTGDEEHQ